MSKGRKTAFLGLMTALAMIFSYIEFLIPISIGIPGIKLGLANLVIIIILYVSKWQEAFLINIARILLSSLLFGNGMSLIYSLTGGILSFFVMLLMKRLPSFSIFGVSVCGAVSHNIGQILAAAVILKNIKIVYYLPPLLIAGVAAGLLIGLLASKTIPAVSKIMHSDGRTS